MLAALLRAPSYYDPAENPAAAKHAGSTCWTAWSRTKHLTKAQEAAIKLPDRAQADATAAQDATGRAAFIEDQVMAELAAHGISEDDVNNRGLTIQTTIDPKAQTAAVTAINQTFSQPDRSSNAT